MSFFDPHERDQAVRENLEEKAQRIRDNISPSTIATHLGCKWDREHKKIVCPSHKGGREKTPSAMVFSDHIYCYACHKWWDVIQLTRDVLGFESWHATVDYLIEQFDSILAENKQQAVYYPTSSEYKGPVPPDLVYYWHTCLNAERRGWLYDRLLTDETIDRALIGWRIDWNAYTIPFWRGEPRSSEIDIIQYRMIDHPKGVRYVGMRGHNRPSIINRHLIGKGSVVLLFGTFDALLCAQDGTAAISTNGATAFLRDGDNLNRLRKLLRGCMIYIMPDKNSDETRAAHLLAGAIEGSVRYFPEGLAGKDYTEMRQAGSQPGAILGEALMGKDKWLIQNDEDDGKVLGILVAISNGDEQTALALFDELRMKYVIPIINQHLQVRMQFDPIASISHERWEVLRTTITNKLSAERLAMWIKDSTQLIYSSKGGF